MRQPKVALTGRERFFDEHEIIVSKTDTRGRITYANDVFMRVAGYRESELLGQPHSLIRHPDMPRCVFKLLWDTIAGGQEIFAYVVNLCKDGDHYWVLAHVTPTFDGNGEIIGYHSNRRVPDRSAVETMASVYRTLRDEERRHEDSMQGMQRATEQLQGVLAAQDIAYDEFVFSLATT